MSRPKGEILEALKSGADTLLILLGAVMVLAMHAGFAFLELGTVRRKSQVNALVKILADFALSTIAYFFIGYTVAYGVNFFTGAETLAQASGYGLVKFFFLLTFAAAIPAIVSGGIAERARFNPQLAASFALVALVYPAFSRSARGAVGRMVRVQRHECADDRQDLGAGRDQLADGDGGRYGGGARRRPQRPRSTGSRRHPTSSDRRAPIEFASVRAVSASRAPYRPQQSASGETCAASASRPRRVAGCRGASGCRTASERMTPPSIITALVARSPHCRFS